MVDDSGALWTSGDRWEPSGQTPPNLWGAVDAGVGWPNVIVGGIRVTDRCTGVSWSTGRSWWLADPEPGTATLELQGTIDAELAGVGIGTPVAILAEPIGTLWTGWIDGINETTVPQDGELAVGLSITASDALSRILSVQLYSSLVLAAGQLDKRLRDLATAAGVPGAPPVRVLQTSGILPQLAAVTLAGSSASPLQLGDHLSACERASNAIVAMERDGSWLILPRARVVTTPEVITLDGDSDPNELQRAIATPDRVRNVFTIAGTETDIATSITKYGRRGYDVPAGVSTTPPPYAPETLAALAEPAPFAVATIPIETRTAVAVPLSPFDWCRVSTRPDDELYQALGFSWRAEPDTWELSVELDRTVMTIAGPPDPNNPDPPDPEPPPTTATVTDTFVCDRSAYVVKTTGGLNAGNGGSVDMLVGLLADGNLARGLLRFAMPWRGKVVSVSSAKLRLHVGQTTCMSPGGSPTTKVSRATASWSPGSYATRCAFSGSNAVVWPGPSATESGQVIKNAPSSTGALYEVDLTAIVRAWTTGSPNYGLRLQGASESSTGDRVPFWSSRAGAGGDRPTLVVTYVYEV